MKYFGNFHWGLLVGAGVMAGWPAAALPPVAGPSVWLTADQGIVADGAGGVERWEDQSGNGQHFEQATESKRPVVLPDGWPIGDFTLSKIPENLNGNTTTTWTMGMDFIVDEEQAVTELAAFDHLRDGFSGTITVQLWSRSDGGTLESREDDTEAGSTILEQLTFTPEAPGELSGAYRWKELPLARTLAPGSYTLVCWGFAGTDWYHSSANYAKPPQGAGVRWLGSRYASGQGVWPGNLYGSYADYFAGAMNLRFHRSGVVPTARPVVSFDGTDDGLWGIEAMNFGRPSTVFVAFERFTNDSGYILQNSSGGNFWIRNDGFYADGWVRNRDFEWGRPQVAAMRAAADSTRVFLGPGDFTENAALSGVAPGRLALGGGSGQQNNPITVRIAEVLVYDRHLSDSEIWETQNYLGERYGTFGATVETPSISPPGGLGAGNVSVTMASGTAGAEIRYTLDGSEPQADSAPYAAALEVPRGTEVRARAFLAGMAASGTAAQVYGDAAAAEVPVDGLTLWLKGDRGVQTDPDGAVERWQDLTGNGNDFVQGDPARRPLPGDGFARGGGVAILSRHGNVGSNTHNGTLGADFEVEVPIVVEQLAAFDHLGDGFSGSVTVQLWTRDDRGTPATPEDDLAGTLLAEAEFTPSSPGTLEGGLRFKDVPAVELAAGSYAILAWGYVGADLYRNSTDASWNGDGIRFVNRSRYIGSNGAWPTTLDSHPVKYNGAGNFRFRRTGEVAVRRKALRFDGVDDGLWALPTSQVPRPSTVYLVFDRESDGILLQSTASWWFVRNDGMYSNGWVRNAGLPLLQPTVVGMVNGSGTTRAYLNGENWTVAPNFGSPEPGRMGLGGGSGHSFNPARCRIAEVLAFDRELSEGERWLVEDYLSRQYRVEQVPLPPVAISPAGAIGTGPVEVSLSHSVAGAEIRYTLDGSEPTDASALYGGPLTVPRGTELRCRAFLAGALPGPVTSAFYGEAGGPDDLPVAGARMWLRADRGLELDTSGAVSRWRDLTGSGNDLVQGVASKRPALRQGAFAGASGVAIEVPESSGNTTYGGSLGEDFVIEEALELTHLGAFDDRGDGFAGTITVQLWSRDDGGTEQTQSDDGPVALLASLTFDSANPGALEGMCRFKPLPSPLNLPPGAYTIMAWGHVGSDRYYEGNLGATVGDPRLRFIGKSRYIGTAGNWPTSLDNARLDYNGAANFKVTPAGGLDAGVPAVVFDGADDGLLGVEPMFFSRPSTVFVVFERDRNESGYILQNSGGGNWWFRNDGFYADGWVLNESFAVGRPYLAAMVAGPGFTRAYRDGLDVTVNPNVASVAPGRLALGGGAGQQNDPLPVSVAEVVVFDRVLDAGEMWTMQGFLADRYETHPAMALAPEISPQSGYGSGEVTVTMSSATPGATIRYTLDGSVPDESSALYSEALLVPRGTEVKARAYAAGAAASPVASVAYLPADQHPLPVTDPAMWLRADRGIEQTDDGSVLRWRDLSGNGRDVTPRDLDRAPKFVSEAVGGAVRPAVAVPPGAEGNTNYGGTIGTDFVIEEPVEITHLGVFDHLADGLGDELTVRVHAVDDQGTPEPQDDTGGEILASQGFSAASPGALEGTTRFIELASPLLLAPGRYHISSHGWNGVNRYVNSDSWDETIDAGISFPGHSRYSNTTDPAALFPGTVAGDNRYLSAGNFKFRREGASGSPAAAVRFDGVDDGMLGPEDFLIERPCTLFMVFQQLGGTDGRLWQSGDGRNFLIGPHIGVDGLYAEGWASQHNIRRNLPAQVAGVLSPGDSRYLFNGADLTQDANPGGAPGRVALGGAEGTYFQPCHADLVELIAYDRVLSPGERQQVSASLAARYGLPLERLLPPVASPDGGYFASGQTVGLSHPIPGATIRYTLDGSEPTEASTEFTAPFLVSADTTVKARAFAAGYDDSLVEESVFFIDPAATVPPRRQDLRLWLRAATGTETESDAVAVWRDLSGKGMDARQPVAAQRPIWNPTALGDAPGVVFDGSDDLMRMPEGFHDFSSGMTAILVARPEATGNWERILDLSRGSNNSNLSLGRYSTTTDFSYEVRGSSYGILRAAGTMLPASNAIFTVSQASDGSVKMFQNGSLVAENPGIPLPATILRTLNQIGESHSASHANFNGAISEIILYNSALGDLERETLEAAVRERYGIATSATGTAAFSPDPGLLYPDGVTVTLESVTPGARIHYTLDGSAPDEGSALYSGPIQLAGSARVRARAFADGFNASQFSEATYYVGQPPSSGDGLLGSYFNGTGLAGEALVRVDPEIDFNWGSGSPDPGIGADNFSARWTGKLMPRFSEDYTFFTYSDDGMRLWVDLDRDGQFDDATELLIDDWTPHGALERGSGPVALSAGQLYDFRAEYFEAVGGAVARVQWSSFSEPKATIPQSQLFANAAFSQTVSTPVISPASGTYVTAVEVAISTATAGATVYYTADGSTPGTNSQVYGGPFEVGADASVKARAFKAGFNPSGIATVAYDIDAQPPLIGSFRWEGAEIVDGESLVAKGELSVEASDNQGVARAEFYYRPAGSGTTVLIGSDPTPGNGLVSAWNIESVPDGDYLVIARVYDVAGTWSETSRNVSIALEPPAAPSITLPASGITVQDPVVAIRVETIPGTNVRLLRDGILVFAGYANSSGRLDYSASLPTGSSQFKARVLNRAGESADSNAVNVTRVREFPQLALSFAEETVLEGTPLSGTVSLPIAEPSDLVVQVTTNKASQFEMVAPVTIPAGSLSADFTLVARQDSLIELPSTVVVTAAAIEHRSAVAELFLADDDYPDIALELERSSVSEEDGSVVAELRRAVATDRSLRVELTNSLPGKLAVPATVEIPAGQASRTFTIPVIDDDLDDGNQIAVLRGRVVVSGLVVAQSPEVSLEVRDNEGPVLALALAKPFLAEGDSLQASLSRSGASNAAALEVSLVATPAGQLTLPSSVQIPAGQDSATFQVSAPSDPLVEGTRTLTLRASAAGFTDSLVGLTLSDRGLAELAVTGLSAPTQALTEEYISVGYRVENYGSGDAQGPFAERIFLSTDPSPGPDDLLVRQIDQSGIVAAGGSYGRNVTVLTPRGVGSYYLIVTVDPGNAVAELNEDNNSTVLIQPIEVRASYSAVVQTDAGIVPANTPIVFTGSATREGGQPASYAMVNIHIGLNGTDRVISAVTNSIGEFSTIWTPLRNEGGVYTIGATHPGTGNAPVQDDFEILTLGLDAPGSVAMNEGETAVTEAVLRNPNGRALSGISFRIDGAPAGLSLSPQLPATTLDSGAEMTVPISVTATAGFSGYGAFPITVETAEGVVMQALLNVRVELLKPVLSLDPGSLNRSVLRGQPRSESIVIANTGGLETGPIQILLPNIPWLSLASPNPLQSIPPGGTAAISLNLAPDGTVPLTLYTGNLAINAANGGSRSLPYRVRVVSDLKGDLEIEVVDELFFFTDAAPKLAGASVTVRDAISAAQIATAVTDEDGLAVFPDLNEGWYRVDVNAAEHDSFSGNYFVNAGTPTREQIFISKQLVKYSWKVEEVEIEDVYQVTIETTFETNVPAPVVTASPSSIDCSDLLALGQTKIVNVTLENHGFIAAQNSMFRFSEHPFYEFTPLVTNIGTIPAKSSLVVPVTITRKGVFGGEGEIITLDGGRRPYAKSSVPCGAGGAVDYNYPCGPHLVDRVVVLAMSGIQGSCGGGGGGSGGYGGFVGGFYGGGGGIGGGGGGSASGGAMSFSSPDPCLSECLLKATLDCLVGFTPAGCPYAIANCLATNGDVLTCAGAALCWAGPVVNGGFCILSYINCYGGFSGPVFGSGPRNGAVGYILTQEARDFAPEVAAAWSRVETILALQELIFGSREVVLLQQEPGMEQVLAEFGAAIRADSPEGSVIDAAEMAAVQASAVANGVDWSVFEPAVGRWNRTVLYYGAGIFEPADVPAGESTDFIARNQLGDQAAALIAAYDESKGMGFVDPFQELLADYSVLRQDLEGSQGGTCAKVKIQLSQSVTMTRTAFQATLELENERDEEITGIGFDLQIRDPLGLPAEDLFNIQVTRLAGLDAVDGNGSLGSRGIGTVQWTLIPRDTAALESPVAYTVGGVIRYRQGTTDFNIPMENIPITVRPDAALDLKYFHQRDVVSDDPYTDEIEPAQPFKLAVMVENQGFGDARNLKIVSSQPEIVDNEKGLFIDFKVIGTEVAGQPLSPSLTADFGTLVPGQRKIATWLLTSTLQGLFTDYEATFEHVSGLGDPRISLLKNVEIHEMIRMIRDQSPGADTLPDFLTNDVADANDYPDTVHYSDGGTDLVTVRETGVFSGAPTAGAPSVSLTTVPFSGWAYIRLPDPGLGEFRLVSVTRADGRVLPLDFNAWQSDRTFIGGGRRPRYEPIVHLVDRDSAGEYTLHYAPAEAADTTPPTSSVAALAPVSPEAIPVFWGGNDDREVGSYTIFVSVDGSAFEPWKSNTRETAAIYEGLPGGDYAFYSIARDAAGNVETKAELAEARTLVGLVNEPPVLAEIPDQSLEEGGLLTVQATATDPDGNDGDIRYSLAASRPGFVIDPVTGTIRWTTGESDGGSSASVTVTATDGGVPAATAQRVFQVAVVDVNQPPAVPQVPPQTLEPGGVLIVDVDASDGDFPTQSLVFSLAEAPAGASIHPQTGLVQWSPQEDQAGANHLFRVVVTDDGSPSASTSMSFSVSVVADQDAPPVFTRVPVVLWLKGKSYSVSLSAMDPDGDPVSLMANLASVPGASFADLGGGNGRLDWPSISAEAGIYQIPLTATANGLSSNAVVRIRIEEDDLYWSWVEETFGELPEDYDLSWLDREADPDGDGRWNLEEMAFLTNPLVPDQVPVQIDADLQGAFSTIDLGLLRRVGTAGMVDFAIERNPGLMGPWEPVPPSDWQAAVDPDGDDDGLSHTERLRFRIFEVHPGGVPEKSFYRLRTHPKVTPEP